MLIWHFTMVPFLSSKQDDVLYLRPATTHASHHKIMLRGSNARRYLRLNFKIKCLFALAELAGYVFGILFI